MQKELGSGSMPKPEPIDLMMDLHRAHNGKRGVETDSRFFRRGAGLVEEGAGAQPEHLHSEMPMGHPGGEMESGVRVSVRS